MFEKRPKYVGNDIDLLEMTQICVETTSLFDKRLNNVNNDVEISELAKIFGKWLRFIRHGLSL